MRVSKSGFYKWLNSDPSPRSKRTALIRASVLEVFQESNGIYGSYKIAEKLKSEELKVSITREWASSSTSKRFTTQKEFIRLWNTKPQMKLKESTGQL